jgi:hypothetical protein
MPDKSGMTIVIKCEAIADADASSSSWGAAGEDFGKNWRVDIAA